MLPGPHWASLYAPGTQDPYWRLRVRLDGDVRTDINFPLPLLTGDDHTVNRVWAQGDQLQLTQTVGVKLRQATIPLHSVYRFEVRQFIPARTPADARAESDAESDAEDDSKDDVATPISAPAPVSNATPTPARARFVAAPAPVRGSPAQKQARAKVAAAGSGSILAAFAVAAARAAAAPTPAPVTPTPAIRINTSAIRGMQEWEARMELLRNTVDEDDDDFQ